jgi:hypothetical protein
MRNKKKQKIMTIVVITLVAGSMVAASLVGIVA